MSLLRRLFALLGTPGTRVLVVAPPKGPRPAAPTPPPPRRHDPTTHDCRGGVPGDLYPM